MSRIIINFVVVIMLLLLVTFLMASLLLLMVYWRLGQLGVRDVRGRQVASAAAPRPESVNDPFRAAGLPIQDPHGRSNRLDSRVKKRASDARSTQQWLVHPWGAHPEETGCQPEATGRRIHAQDGGRRLIECGVPTVQLPLAHA